MVKIFNILSVLVLSIEELMLILLSILTIYERMFVLLPLMILCNVFILCIIYVIFLARKVDAS